MSIVAAWRRPVRKERRAAVCPAADGIAVAVVRPGDGVAPQLERCAFQPFAPEEDARRTLQRLARAQRLQGLPVSSTLDIQSYSLLLVEAPDVPPAELRAAMRWRIKDLIDFHVDDAVIDVFEVPARRSGGGRLMYAVAARAALVRQRVDQLLDAGLKLDCIDIPELALRNITALLPEDVGGVALVYLRPEGGLVAVTRQGTLFLSRQMEVGTAGVLDAKVSEEQRSDWLDAVVVEIQRSLDYYESHFGQPPVAGVVLSPMARELPGAVEHLAGQLGAPVRMLDVNDIIDSSAAPDHELQYRCLLAIGAALRREERSL